MKSDILVRIGQRMDALSKGQKRIAQLLHERPDETCFMTAAQIGKSANVSESTVVRFACELGYKGFPELQKDLQKIALSRIGSTQHIYQAEENMDDEKRTCANKNIDNIQKTMHLLDGPSFENAVDRLKSCRNIYLYSDEYSRGLLHYLKFHLSAVYESVTVAESPADWMHVCPQDGAIYLGFGDGDDCVQALSYARDHGAYITGFAGSALAPAASFCDAVFAAVTDGCRMIPSLTAPICLLQIFLEYFLEGKQEQYCDTMEKLKEYRRKS